MFNPITLLDNQSTPQFLFSYSKITGVIVFSILIERNGDFKQLYQQILNIDLQPDGEILPGSDSDVTLSIADAAADGSTKGASTYTAADFNAASGVISLDYANGQNANATQHGFLSDTDWATFNGKGTGTKGLEIRFKFSEV